MSTANNEVPLYITDNIIIGSGEVPAIRSKQGIVWVLPGGRHTRSQEEAIACAVQLDKLYRRNQVRRRKEIRW